MKNLFMLSVLAIGLASCGTPTPVEETPAVDTTAVVCEPIIDSCAPVATGTNIAIPVDGTQHQ